MKIDFRKDKRTYPRGLVAISWGDEYNRRTKETLKDVRFVIHLFPSYDSDDDQERHWLGF